MIIKHCELIFFLKQIKMQQTSINNNNNNNSNNSTQNDFSLRASPMAVSWRKIRIFQSSPFSKGDLCFRKPS